MFKYKVNYMTSKDKSVDQEPVNNMRLWNRVCETNPFYTKQVEGGFKMTAICAQSQRRQATQVFGPCGQGWYIENEKYQIFNENRPEIAMIAYTATFGYFDPETKELGRFPIASSMYFNEYLRDGKIKRNSDIIKKIRTDALTKGLSELGFNADVFMGLFDDNKYVAALRNKYAEPVTSVIITGLPEATVENKTILNRVYEYFAKQTPNMPEPGQLARAIYMTLGKWPETPEDEKHLIQSLKWDAPSNN